MIHRINSRRIKPRRLESRIIAAVAAAGLIALCGAGAAAAFDIRDFVAERSGRAFDGPENLAWLGKRKLAPVHYIRCADVFPCSIEFDPGMRQLNGPPLHDRAQPAPFDERFSPAR